MPAASTPTPSNPANHKWRFFRAGGFDQVRLETGADLVHLEELDQKLWVSLACPTRGLEFDTKTLDLIDCDQDGRIRAPDILAAVKWAVACLKNPDDLVLGLSPLPLAAINDATSEGQQLLASARQILANLGKNDVAGLSLDDTADTTRIFAQTQFNGDGVVPADAADAATQAVVNDIIACLGAETDRSGKPGVSQPRVDQFFAEAQAYSDWQKKAEAEVASILPFGDRTADAAAALRAVQGKVDDYFARCRLAAFDPRALAAVNRQESEYLALAAKDMSITAAEVAGFPLARIEANKPLPLKDGINPAWAAAMADLNALAVKPLFGDKAHLTESEWAALTAQFAAYHAWLASKPAGAVEKLGLNRVREILAGKSREDLSALIARDKALEAEAGAIAAVDKLVRFTANLHKLLNNFVNFRDFYLRRDKSIFQAGTLYLDQRSCDLCLAVEDAGKHAGMAGLAGTYLAYCDCTRKATGEKRQIVAAFTAGDSENLMVGRNGVFYDRRGRDWDATITKIIDNPISLRQAFWAPYKKLVRMIEEQVAKRAAAAEAASAANLAKGAETIAQADNAPTKAAEPKKVDVGTVAALGVAIGSLGTAFGYFLKTIADVKDWQFPLLLLAVVLAISGPSVIIAYLKLRKRNLGPILDANGWAVNARAKINVPFGGSLTQVASLPVGTQLDAMDAFAERRSLWPRLLAVLFVLWWIYAFLNTEGHLYRITDGRFGKPPAQAADRARPATKLGDAGSTAPTNAPAK